MTSYLTYSIKYKLYCNSNGLQIQTLKALRFYIESNSSLENWLVRLRFVMWD